MLSGAASRISISDGKDVKKIIKNIETEHGTYPKADASFFLFSKNPYLDFSLFKRIAHIIAAAQNTRIRYHRFSRQKP